MYYRPISDLHIEFDTLYLKKLARRYPEKYQVYTPSVLPTDKETILGIAGDIATKKLTYKFLKELSTRFLAVVAILGNHDYWRRDLTTWVDTMRSQLIAEGITNVHILHRDSVVIEGFRFIGATLWTDFNKGDQITLNAAQTEMSDYKFMRRENYSRKVKPIDILGEHIKDSKFIFSFAQHTEEPTIVLSHHAPSWKSLDFDRYKVNDPLNYMYATEFGNEISHSNFLIWHHGHVHKSHNYKIYETSVICNPRGYFGKELNKNFNDQILIRLK